MSWTTPTAMFFVALGLALTGMTLWELASPCVPRRGRLPWVTTRGDRFFLGLIAAGCAQLAWVGFTDASGWIGLAPALVVALVIGRWA